MFLREGNSGPEVKILQKVLGVTIDGVFGEETKSAVIGYQQAHGLEGDGIVGPLTIDSLKSHYGMPALPDEPETPVVVPPSVVVAPPGMWKPTGKGPVQVVDLFHQDDVLNWNTLASHAACVIHKASTGTHLKDSKFRERWPLIKAHGMRRGSYHWFEETDGAAQFDYFLEQINAAGGLEPTDRILALDYEPPTIKKSHNVIIEAWGERCKEKTGRIPFFYGSKSDLPELGHPSYLKGFYNWLAAPSDTIPPVIAPFTFVALHQYAESTFPGMGGNLVDCNRFPGSAEELDLL